MAPKTDYRTQRTRRSSREKPFKVFLCVLCVPSATSASGSPPPPFGYRSGRHRRADAGGDAAAQLACEEHGAYQRQDHEAQEGPVGDRATQEGPVDLGAVTAAAEDQGNGALEREGLDHPVE